MHKFLDKIVDAILAMVAGKDKVNSDMAAFLDKGKNKLLILSILFFIPFLLIAIFIYGNLDNPWWGLVPILVFSIIVFIFAILLRMDKRFNEKTSKSKRNKPNFDLDLDKSGLKKLYAYLLKYEYINDGLTNYQDFYNVMTLDFADNDSTIHFNMNLAELKYLLEHIKKFGRGVTLTTFERSNKFYNKGKPISQRNLTSAYSEKIPDEEFRDHLDHFFEYLT